MNVQRRVVAWCRVGHRLHSQQCIGWTPAHRCGENRLILRHGLKRLFARGASPLRKGRREYADLTAPLACDCGVPRVDMRCVAKLDAIQYLAAPCRSSRVTPCIVRSAGSHTEAIQGCETKVCIGEFPCCHFGLADALSFDAMRSRHSPSCTKCGTACEVRAQRQGQSPRNDAPLLTHVREQDHQSRDKVVGAAGVLRVFFENAFCVRDRVVLTVDGLLRAAHHIYPPPSAQGT